jgi:hypothetical protein
MQKDRKMIAVSLRFWTNDLKVECPDSKKSPIASWDGGVAILEANKEKGIVGTSEIFNCAEDIQPAIKELFRRAKIVTVCANMRPRLVGKKKKKGDM